MSRCPHCQAALPPMALHCVQCGQPLPIDTVQDPATMERLRVMLSARMGADAGADLERTLPESPQAIEAAAEPEPPPTAPGEQAPLRRDETPAARPLADDPRRLPAPGDRIEGYEIREEVGRGGMGRVYRARHRVTGQEVALKMLLPKFARDARLRRRFVNEAKVLATLEHPNLVPLLGFVEVAERAFIVMPYVRGITLEKMLRKQGRLAVRVAVELFEQVCAAVEHAHAHDVLHRDLKPSNVIVRGDGRVVVTDFGIARAVGSDRLTRTGMVVGTAEYLAPEQAVGTARDDPRSDVYALGILLYEMLTGRVPFHHPNPAEVLQKQVSAPVPPPRLVVPEMPERLEQVLFTALAKTPEDRFPSVTELRLAAALAVADVPALEAAAAPRAEPEPTETIPPAAIAHPRVWRGLGLLGLVLLAALVAGGVWWFRRG